MMHLDRKTEEVDCCLTEMTVPCSGIRYGAFVAPG